MTHGRITKWLTTGFCVAALAACSAQHPRHGMAIDHIHATIDAAIAADRALIKRAVPPRVVSRALLPRLSTRPSGAIYQKDAVERHFDLAVKNAPAASFFMGLVKGTPYNMVLSPDVKGVITLNLKNVTVEDVLETVRDMYGYDYHQTSRGYEVFASGLQTRIFPVNYLNLTRKGTSMTRLTSSQISEKVGTSVSGGGSGTSNSSTTSETTQTGSTIETKTKTDFWKNLSSALKSLVGDKDGRSVVVNAQSGLVVVKAMPVELRQVEGFLASLQSSMDRQVVLEAKILEVELNDGYEAGVDWKALGAQQTSNKDFTGTNIKKDFANIFTFGTNMVNVLRLLSTQGNVQVLSNPRITTINNETAIIKVGRDEFFVTGIANNTALIGGGGNTTQDIHLTPFFSGVSLEVTPQIDRYNDVTLHVHPVVSTVVDQQKTFTVSSQEQQLPLALSSIRETDNIVHAKNGQVIVIGGLMQNSMSEDIAATPWAGKIPVVGSLFRHTKQHARKSELIILLCPQVVTNRTWQSHLRHSNAVFKQLRRGFHLGSKPEVFGNHGEING